MKRIITLVLSTLLMLLSLSSCSLVLFNTYKVSKDIMESDISVSTEKNIYIDHENSSFSDAQRTDDQVVYICQIAICNETGEGKSITLVGDFEKEYDMGIITDIFLGGETELGERAFYVPAESTEYYTVCFRGTIREDYKGEELKTDRLLPEIELFVMGLPE